MGQTLFKKPIIGPSQNKSSPSLTSLYFYYINIQQQKAPIFWALLRNLSPSLDRAWVLLKMPSKKE